jgi:hypothetical protein
MADTDRRETGQMLVGLTALAVLMTVLGIVVIWFLSGA